MKISARNQFAGKVTAVKEGAVNGIVTIDVNGTPVTATISMASIKELGLEAGRDAVAVPLIALHLVVGQEADGAL